MGREVDAGSKCLVKILMKYGYCLSRRSLTEITRGNVDVICNSMFFLCPILFYLFILFV